MPGNIGKRIFDQPVNFGIGNKTFDILDDGDGMDDVPIEVVLTINIRIRCKLERKFCFRCDFQNLFFEAILDTGQGFRRVCLKTQNNYGCGVGWTSQSKTVLPFNTNTVNRNNVLSILKLGIFLQTLDQFDVSPSSVGICSSGVETAFGSALRGTFASALRVKISNKRVDA